MKNYFNDGATKISIPPTSPFSVIGKIEDARKSVTMDVKRPGDIVYLLGTTGNEMGGSEYLALRGGIGNIVPKVNPEKALKRYRALHMAITGGLIASCHDLSDGGLAVALAETAFAGGYGIAADLGRVLWGDADPLRNDAVLLFSESASRHLVTVRPENRDAFETAMAGNCFSAIGTVTEEAAVAITGLSGKTVVNAGIEELKEAWQSPLREL
jgi:phosphoribosylformylglycinamidine synthase